MNLEKREEGRNYALRLIGYRERSMREVEIRMEKRGYGPQLIKEILEELKSCDLINDKRFARTWTESRIKRGYGREKIILELREKGIEEKVIKELLRDIYSEVDERRVAEEIIRRKKIPLQEKGKLCRFLTRRGFTFETINEICLSR